MKKRGVSVSELLQPPTSSPLQESERWRLLLAPGELGDQLAAGAHLSLLATDFSHSCLSTSPTLPLMT